MKGIDLSVVIVTWNSADFITGCLESVIKSASDYKFEIILVDNDSKDNTVDQVRRRFPEVKILKQNTNLGFGQGNNIGISHARGKFILLLNPDTVVNKRAIRKMYEFLVENKTVGAVGPEQLNAENRIIFTYSRHSLRGIAEYIAERVLGIIKGEYRIIFSTPYEVRYLNLGCVMTRREIWEQGVTFDPGLFLYGEEATVFPKIGRLGWRVFFLRNCFIYHFRGKSISKTGKKFWFAIRSWKYILKKKCRLCSGSLGIADSTKRTS